MPGIWNSEFLSSVKSHFPTKKLCLSTKRVESILEGKFEMEWITKATFIEQVQESEEENEEVQPTAQQEPQDELAIEAMEEDDSRKLPAKTGSPTRRSP